MTQSAAPQFTAQDVPEPDWADFIADPDQQTAASDYWHNTVAAMRQAGTLAAANSAQVKRYVLALVLYDLQAAALFAEGTMRQVNRRTPNKTTNPRWGIYKDCDTITTMHEARLGLSPTGRGDVTPAIKTKTQTKADAFLRAI